MYNVIVAFPKLEDAKSIKNILVQNGISVNAVVTSAASVISTVEELDGGIVLCSYRFRDMYYKELKDYLPEGFQMLLLASATKMEEVVGNDIIALRMPFKTFELINTIEMMLQAYQRRKKREKPKERSIEEEKLLEKAKALLMERNNMSEVEAHRYIQKTSMDSGTNMVETAEMILSIM
ncbi:MAG: ANTAR domain-containing response regulator [Velocimicrobium sp.]